MDLLLLPSYLQLHLQLLQLHHQFGEVVELPTEEFVEQLAEGFVAQLNLQFGKFVELIAEGLVELLHSAALVNLQKVLFAELVKIPNLLSEKLDLQLYLS